MIINEDFFDSDEIEITTHERSVFYEKDKRFGYTIIFLISYTNFFKQFNVVKELQKRLEKVLNTYVDEFEEPVYVINDNYTSDTKLNATYYNEAGDYVVSAENYTLDENYTDILMLYHFNIEHMSIKRVTNFYNSMKFALKEYGNILSNEVYVQKFTDYYRVNYDFEHGCQIGSLYGVNNLNLTHIYILCNMFGKCTYASILNTLSDKTENSGADELVSLFMDRTMKYVGKYSLEGFNDNLNGLFNVVRLYSPIKGYNVSNSGPIADIFYTLNTDTIPKNLYNYIISTPLRLYA